MCPFLFPAAAATGGTTPSWFEAHTTGTRTLTLRGTAEFGPVAQPDGPGRFVITMGAESPTGAVIFTRPAASRPEPGVYQVADDAPGAVKALVVTGSPTQPTGVFRGQVGTVEITTSRDDFIAGRFEFEAAGYMAEDDADEDRPLRVRGTFTATPGSRDVVLKK